MTSTAIAMLALLLLAVQSGELAITFNAGGAR